MRPFLHVLVLSWAIGAEGKDVFYKETPSPSSDAEVIGGEEARKLKREEKQEEEGGKNASRRKTLKRGKEGKVKTVKLRRKYHGISFHLLLAE